jgi:hypothetical protein
VFFLVREDGRDVPQQGRRMLEGEGKKQLEEVIEERNRSIYYVDNTYCHPLMKARLREPSSILNLGLIIRCKRKNGKP